MALRGWEQRKSQKGDEGVTGEVDRKSRVTPWKASQENDLGRKA